jgi:hypothetical protein
MKTTAGVVLLVLAGSTACLPLSAALLVGGAALALL